MKVEDEVFSFCKTHHLSFVKEFANALFHLFVGRLDVALFLRE
jgi:hypothetical protein